MSESAGRKDQRFTFRYPEETTDTEGNPVKNWINVRTVWGRVDSLTGREYERVRSINSEISKKFTVEYRRDMVKKQPEGSPSALKYQVVWDGWEWNIHDIQASDDRRDMALFVSRVQ